MNEYSITVGIDLGDTHSAVCVLDSMGEIVEEASLRTTTRAFERRFKSMEPSRIAIETGTHSRWVSELLASLGHEVIVGDARRLRMIYCNENKTDRLDANTLARIARFDPALLHQVQHRGQQAHADLEVLKARELLVGERKRLVTHIRNVVKAMGERLPSCDTDYFVKKTRELVPDRLKTALDPLYAILESLNEQIRNYDAQIAELGQTQYPETELLREITGVGPITSLAYVLTIDDPYRFSRSRQVGSYFGLRPRLSQSGQSDPQLPISKCGNGMMRRLLVQAAHHILGPFGPDSDLRRFGLRLAESGGKRAKKRAVIAVARKLSVLLHRLWITGEIYDPLYLAKQRGEAA